jgi:serine/threonine-protein phosphatase 4 catalytic subunit
MTTNTLEVDSMIALLRQRILPSELQIKELCEKATAILGEEDNVQVIQAPVTICGDLHGARVPCAGQAALLALQ